MQTRQLTFRLLQVFADVVASGSISLTAQRLHLTQPTVSQQLSRLRDIVGEPILQLEARRQVPTEVGLALYQLSQDVLNRANAFQQSLSEYRSGERGHFSIALVTTAQTVIPRLLGHFSRHFPQADVTLELGNRQQIMTRFTRHEDDLYVFSHPPHDDAVRAEPFLRNPLVLIAPADSRWSARQSLSFSELLAERFLIREPGSATYHVFDTWLESHGYTLNSTQQLASNEAIREAVAAGMGLAVVSRHVLMPGDRRIEILAADEFPLESQWQFVVHRDRRLPPVARQFLSSCQHSIPGLFPQDSAPLRTDLLHSLTQSA